MSNNEKKEVTKSKSSKNTVRKYLNFVLLMVAIILVAIIVSKLYKNHQENKLGTSVFSKSVGELQYDDIESMTSEMPSVGFILISYTKNENVKKFESSLKKVVVENDLQNNFYYLDVSDAMLEENFIENLNKKFNLDEVNQIKELPALLYYQDGKFKRTITSTDARMMNVDDFSKLLDSYEIVEAKN